MKTEMNRHWHPEPEQPLTAVAPDVWIARHPLVFYGFRMFTCMTVVRLASGKLWVHSPVPLEGDRKAALDALGPVAYIVAPNRLHHLFAMACATQYPAAQLFVAPNLASKNRAFASCPLIPPGPAAPWASEIDGIFVEGNTELNETVFLHRASRTLIITDLAVYLGPWDSAGTRLYARLSGCYHRFGLSFLLKTFFRDRAAARNAIGRIASWNFERIILAHGPVIREDARRTFDAAFKWLK